MQAALTVPFFALDMTTPTLLIADDHQLMREAVAQLIGREFGPAQFEFAGSLAEVLALLDPERQSASFALVLLDLKMPGMRGLDSVARIVQACAPAPVLVWTGVESPDLAPRLQAVGVAAVVSKGAHTHELLAAIQALKLGVGHPTGAAALATRPQPPMSPPSSAKTLLTVRQFDLLCLLHEGKPNKLIARELDLSLGTVKNHMSSMFLRLQVNSRAELLALTREWFL